MYPDMTPVISLNFICHCCNIFEYELKHRRHLEQVVFFGWNKKIGSLTQNQALLHICPIRYVHQMSYKQEIVNCAVYWFADELLILESADYFITSNQLCHH